MKKQTLFTLIGSFLVLSSVLLLVLLVIGPSNAASASESTWSPIQPLAVAPGDILINEFIATPTGDEAIELYNMTGADVDVSGWTMNWGYGSNTITNGQVIPAGGYLVLTAANVPNLEISNNGTVLSLVTGTVTVDSVGYGDDGGCPKPLYAFSAGRSPNGTDTDDDAADFNMAITPTLGTTNTHPAANLGGSPVRINEIMPNDTSGEERVEFIELYNDSGNAVDIGGYMLHVDDDYYFATGVTITAQGFYTVSGVTINDTAPYFNLDPDEDNLYLYDDAGARIDQVGWDARDDVLAKAESFQRNPDGVGPYDGYNWATSGGDATLFQVPPTMAASNVFEPSIKVIKTAPLRVDPGALFTYTIMVENALGFALNDIVITDVVPTNATFAYALDGGAESSGVVTWPVVSLSYQDSITVRFAVTATSSITRIANADYVVAAANLITPAVGGPVVTIVDTRLGIHYVQGSGFSSPLIGATDVVIGGVVVGDFQDTTNQLSGFFIQEEDVNTDANPLTSEGIFIYDDGLGVDVNVGDVVRVQGDVNEYGGLTRLTNIDSVVVISSGVSISPTNVMLPLATGGAYEPYEGMLVTFPQDLTVTEVYYLGRYGQVSLSQGGRLFNPTNVITPGVAANDLQAANDLRRLVLDDGNVSQNPDPAIYPSPELSATNTLRVGYTVTGVTGVLDAYYGYRLQPTIMPTFVPANPRTAAPEAVGGTLSVASFNVLNYFSTIDTGAEICGPDGDQECRGADSSSEFNRQRDKIVNAIVAIDADIVGLIEIENNAITATQDLVDGLNAVVGAGTYDYVDTSTIGGDAIKVAFIYQPGTVTLVGSPAILDSSVDPLFNDDLNRPALAQTFEQNGTGERFTAVVNHLKSKGSDCDDVGDPDTGDGQGNCNVTRTNAATAMVNWLATDPTGSGDPDFLIIGDLNSYAKEDPIAAIEGAGYTNLLDTFIGAEAYSYVYDGQSGYLDHALSSSSLIAQVVSATVWHINTDEPSALDYNEEYKSPGHVISLYNDDPYRASDHDPVIVGLDLVSNYYIYLPLVVRNG
jgi:uncharacterized repeat protein (TIGR01451 family)